MNSALKPVLPSSGPQNPPVTAQLNKPMHPQGSPATYGQPSTHMPQSLVNLPHGNPNVAHNHPNPAHQSNHYSLNVPNAPQHYSNNPSTIPASNHPIPNSGQSNVGGQSYPSPNKNVPYSGGYQPNLGHPPNQNPLPPVSQTLPPTQPPHVPETLVEKPQSNGTPEIKTPEENHVSDKEKPSSPAKPEKIEEKPTEPVIEQKEETKSEVVSSSSPVAEVSEPAKVPETKPEVAPEQEEEEEEEEEEDKDAQSTESEDNISQDVSEEKPKEKEQKASPAGKTTPRTPTRKSKTPRPEGDSPKNPKTTPTQKSPSLLAKAKRTRTRTQHYQSPLPEIEIITKISSSIPRSKNSDDKLIVFFKNEFLAVRNSEGSFYICQAVQNIYKSSPKIRIRWLSLDKSDKSGEVYAPDFYDNTDFDCILTNLNLERVDKGKYRLPPAEKERTDSILKRSLAVEKGEVTSPSLTEEHPDGIDLSLYKQESQLKKGKGTKRKASSSRKGRKPRNPSKSPEPKVRKVVKKAAKKIVRKTAVPVTPTTSRRTTSPSSSETRTSASSSRSDRAKRRNDNQNHSKVSPVVDQKKARVLAKVVRKVMSTGTKISPPVMKNSRTSKPVPSSSKVQKPPPKAATRKTKRSKK